MADTSVTDKLGDGEYLNAWRQFKDENPAAYTAAAVAPVTGQLAAVADYADAWDRGDEKDAALASASLIPGVKLAKFGSKLAPAAHELAMAKQFAPDGARAVMAPITERADKIGKAAAFEQVGEYLRKKADDAKEYIDSWRKN